jgi:serine/threonine protein kinase
LFAVGVLSAFIDEHGGKQENLVLYRNIFY